MTNTITLTRIRGRKLQRIREQLMRTTPLCHGPDSQCEKAIPRRIVLWTELDHIEPLWKGGQDEPSNRQGLCAECHRAKTGRDMGYKPRIAIGVDGYPVTK